MITIDVNKACNKLLITCTNLNVFTALREHFSVENAGASFIRKKLGPRAFVSNRKYVITPSGKADIGIFWEIRAYLLKDCIAEQIILTDNLKAVLNIRNNTVVCDNLKFPLRDYQYESVSRALKYGWGNIILGTGAGKTLTTAALIESYFNESANKENFKCLVVVPDLGLATQTHEEFAEYNPSFTYTIWTGKHEPDLSANVVICNMGILRSRFTESAWVRNVDVLIADEVHKIKPDNKITEILDNITTRKRFGFTGTLPLNNLEKWFILGKFGPVLYNKTSFELREENYLVDVKVTIFNIHYNDIHAARKIGHGYQKELNYIYNSELRNKFIGKLTDALSNNTLILVNHIEHGQTLLDIITQLAPNKQIFFINGSVDVDERDRLKELMETHDNVVFIAISAIFSTGINIKNLHNIFFVSGGKAFIRIVQSIGRGLRKHESKHMLKIYDFCDTLPYSIQHCEERKKIYKREKIQTVEKIVDLSQ